MQDKTLSRLAVVMCVIIVVASVGVVYYFSLPAAPAPKSWHTFSLNVTGEEGKSFLVLHTGAGELNWTAPFPTHVALAINSACGSFTRVYNEYGTNGTASLSFGSLLDCGNEYVRVAAKSMDNETIILNGWW